MSPGPLSPCLQSACFNHKCCGTEEMVSPSRFFLQGVPHRKGNKPLPGDPEESLQRPCFGWSVDGTEEVLQTSGAGSGFVSLQQLTRNSVCHVRKMYSTTPFTSVSLVIIKVRFANGKTKILISKLACFTRTQC